MRNLVITCALALTACSEDPETAIIGSWQGRSLQQDFRFHAGGATELLDRKHGTYRGICRIDDDVMTCSFERFARPVVRNVEIRGDALYLTSENGREEVYERM